MLGDHLKRARERNKNAARGYYEIVKKATQMGKRDYRKRED